MHVETSCDKQHAESFVRWPCTGKPWLAIEQTEARTKANIEKKSRRELGSETVIKGADVVVYERLFSRAIVGGASLHTDVEAICGVG